MPAVVACRPQSSEQMFQALKQYILKERQKKKQEQEADAEVERQRKERELQQKQDVMTLEENREQIAQLEQTLNQLKDEKHQLFLQLKKVLNEDERRRQQETSNEVVDMYGGLYTGVSPMPGQLSQLVIQQPNYVPMPDRPMYKVPPTHSFLSPPSLKRPRSPSPPPHKPHYSQHYPQKPAPPPPQRVVTYQKGSYSYYHHGPGPPPAQPAFGYPGQQFGPSSSRTEVSHPDSQSSKHHIYMTQPMPHPVTSWHTPLDKFSLNEDKYYPVAVASIRPATHVPVHGGAIPIQQPAQGTKTGGITSGYPIRPPSSAPPQPHLVVPSSNTTHGVYPSQPSSSRLVYSQAPHYLPRDL
ncbi:G protein pathway suppressor 2 isoform X2 [Cimex lectularius]|nr:G protein pathway suppressor 2 isoform X2 [Cimex lectularius]XP_014247217.1 G protein pathway suppressor 2 isoform X2 [Cimex lectularius]